ncbi:sensor histidine kinase [Lysinimonas soli]|uniref:histidine kinase n=1 Tax=Lysinimonas soli TaxID=1074233 RepID=A0ABW0NNN4_9MICO
MATEKHQHTLYARLWLGLPRELGYLLPILPIGIVSIVVLTSLFFTGVGMAFIFVGLFLVLAALFVGRGFGMFEIIRLRFTGFPEITPPAWDRKARGSSVLAKIFAPFIDVHYWLYLLWAMFVGPILGFITWSIAFAWVVTALSGTTFGIFGRFIPSGARTPHLLDTVFRFFGLSASGLPREVGNGVLYFIVGLIALLTLPFVTRGLTALHWGIARGMLGVFTAEQLKQQVAGLSSSRSAAVAAEGTALRRLERDIHDGPQQRLVRLQMDLASAERQLDKDPDAARALIGEAMQQSKDALEELRALSRGFAPPLLLDRGLVAALGALATRATIPVRFVSDVPEGMELPPELERNAYFIAAEAVTNAEKHSRATGATLRVWLRRIADSDETWLELTVSDDGVGGAVATPGHGLAGLEERVHGLGGILTVTSPRGGPTVVIAQLPVTSALPASAQAPTVAPTPAS